MALPEHNEALAGDTLYSIQFNYEWRKIVASALQFYFKHDDEGLALDNEDLLNLVLEDLYTAEAIGASMETRTHTIVLGANADSTSTSYTQMLDLEFSHNFTKANARIRWIAFVVNSGANDTFIKPWLESLTGVYGAEARNFGATGRTLVISDTFEGIAPGARDVCLSMKVSAGLGRINSGFNVICEIEEYD